MGGGKGGGLTRIDLPLTGATDATRSQNVMPTGTSARYRSKCRASRTAILQAQHALGFFDLAAYFATLNLPIRTKPYISSPESGLVRLGSS